jgi:hypothetical protein
LKQEQIKREKKLKELKMKIAEREKIEQINKKASNMKSD